MNKIILDLWFQFQPEHETLDIMATLGDGQDISLAQLYMSDDEYKLKDYENLYNLCLKVANDLGYHLAANIENEYFMYQTYNEEEPICFDEWY